MPPGGASRPTRDMVREAVFDMVASAGGLDGATVADLFAGSGAMGIEALSRGAARATFVDADQRAVACVRANLAVLGPMAALGEVVCADVPSWLGRRQAAPTGGFELVLCDPPYAFERWDDLFVQLEGAVAAEALVVIESGRPIGPPQGWASVRCRSYGASVVCIVRSPQRSFHPISQKGPE